MATSDFEELTERIREFARARDWEQFHNPKNLSMALVAEAAELVEEFQWLTLEESTAAIDDADRRAAIEDEIADVAIYLLRMADVVGVDLRRAVEKKLKENDERFPPSSEPSPGSTA